MAEHPYEKGFIVRRLKRVADWLKRALPMGWFECVWPFSASGTEWYVIGWFVSGFVISVGVCSLYDCVAAVRWLAYLLAALVYLLALLRVPEIIARTTTVDFSDVISTQRSLVLAAINYVELMLWFGLIYALNFHSLHGASQPATLSTSASSPN